ncbi:hypothetical protein CWC28_05525, partial [Pseudoalteromonas sp. S4492]
NLSLTALKISHLEQLNNEIFALLSTRFYCLKIDYLIKRIGIRAIKERDTFYIFCRYHKGIHHYGQF